jgi:hypothetical protein
MDGKVFGKQIRFFHALPELTPCLLHPQNAFHQVCIEGAILKGMVLDELIKVVLFPVILVAGKIDQVFCKVDVITVVPVGQDIVFRRVYVVCDKLFSHPANPNIRRLFCDLFAQYVKGAFLVTGTKWAKSVGRAFLRVKEDQDALVPLEPHGLIVVPPDEQVGESELGDLGRVFG